MQQSFHLPSTKILKRLQILQNTAARLLTGTKRFDHITPVLASLHWLPVCLRVDFKILLLTFRALHGLAPDYILDLSAPYAPNCNLGSLNRGLLFIPESRLRTKGDKAFVTRAPKLWNEEI